MTAPTDVPARPPRPRTVTVAVWLQLASVLVLLGLVALVIVQAVQWDGHIDRAVRAVPDVDPGEVSAERWGNVTGALFISVPVLLLAVWYAATARPVHRGGNVARILVFVGAGLQLLVCLGQGCLGVVFLPMLLAGAGFDEAYPDDGDPPAEFWEDSAFLDALYGTTDPFDAVFFPLGVLGALLVFLLTAAVVLLLVLPPAHRWFVAARPVPPPLSTIPAPYLAAEPVPPAYAPPDYAPPGYVPPGYQPPGYFTVPPGYLSCPDPSAHAPSGAQVVDPGSPSGVDTEVRRPDVPGSSSDDR
ncbi:hypothetical protein QTQ03_19020 [Micromonospora sp. WMMA1363]|uniref:hypothetical protein n=1 Tax=Micromonospora sp. WMMA1363 TaxID=3053985 RepID=UPI00259C9D70|nr:hypothetical protein [Micromonospora sp. WMMA1363]MDM4721579.1 hypothetical protein [Micromonospora sp. WMMA1363]